MDFYRNIDKYSDLFYGVSYNQVLDVEKAAVVTEPVTLNELKEFAKVSDSADDAILTALIKAARDMCEKYANISFVQREFTAFINNVNGGTALPYGPVGTLNVYNFEDEAVTPTVYGTEWKRIDYPRMNLKCVYQGGYATLPEDLKLAVKAQALFLYENRGDSNNTMSPVARMILDVVKRL